MTPRLIQMLDPLPIAPSHKRYPWLRMKLKRLRLLKAIFVPSQQLNCNNVGALAHSIGVSFNKKFMTRPIEYKGVKGSLFIRIK